MTLLGSLIVMDNFFLLTSFLNYNQKTGYQGVEDISVLYPVRTTLLFVGLIIGLIGFYDYDSAVKNLSENYPCLEDLHYIFS